MNSQSNLHTEVGPVLGLLMAGEGSRLWGISAALAFAKGLTNVLGLSLFEQTTHQLIGLLSQAPNRGEGLVVVAGTDNVLLPSTYSIYSSTAPSGVMHFSSALPRDVDHPSGPGNHLFFFSKKVQVLDDEGNVISQEVLQELAQLGTSCCCCCGGGESRERDGLGPNILYSLQQE